MTIRLYDSLSRTVRELVPLDGKTFRYYCCGPTVYGPAHIGNFRSFVLQDVFRRTLETSGQKVFHVRNLTDVDDKTIGQAREEGRPLKEITNHWTKKFHEDAEALGLLRPHEEPAATDHIAEQIALIEKLIEKDHAYAVEDGSVYFRVSSFEDYGKLSRLKEREIRTEQTNENDGAPIDADEYQRDSAVDFALWKGRKPEDGDVFWESPWGEGRPGWHIECSAMSMTYLGETFDLHGGGVDLIFPHHENEIAQSEAGTCKPFAKHWFHTAHLMVDGQKMSKSLGNLFTVDEVRERGFSPLALRYLLLSGNYRQPLNFTWESLHSAVSALERLSRFHDALVSRADDTKADTNATSDFASFQKCWDALANDLNTPAALGALFSAIRTIRPTEISPSEAATELQALNRVLYAFGIDLPEEKATAEIPSEIAALAEKRWNAKTNRDFATADQIRDELKAAGWNVLDSKNGYELEKI
ncbi:MAG TPA: cysteine--tRNA ligase [Opitutales bacterium]|nr:cysteine--tRNA ligase [Opitutales bacterium]